MICNLLLSIQNAFPNIKAPLSVKTTEGTNLNSIPLSPPITALHKSSHSKGASLSGTCLIALGYRCHLSDVNQPPHPPPSGTSPEPACGDQAESNISGLS